jgi:hypothetical protein
VGGGPIELLSLVLSTAVSFLVVSFLLFLLLRDFRRFRARRLAARTARARTPAPPPRIAPPQPRPAPQGRCPFCHEDVDARACVVCALCLARHHDDCWTEGGACAACRATERLGRIDQPRDRVQEA